MSRRNSSAFRIICMPVRFGRGNALVISNTLRTLCILSAIAAASACTRLTDPNKPWYKPNNVGADRSYALAACSTSAAPPCALNAAASHTNYVDSAKVQLRRDRTALWIAGWHSWNCPCYLGGCLDPCYLAKHSTVEKATYEIRERSVVLSKVDSAHTVLAELTTSVPQWVRGDWLGPDSLVYGKGDPVDFGVLRPSQPFTAPRYLLTVTPASSYLSVGDTIRFSATVQDLVEHKDTQRATTWISRDTSLLVIDSSGFAHARYREGLTYVVARAADLSDSVSVFVDGAPVLFPTHNVLLPGLQRTLRVESFNRHSGTLSQLTATTWSSSDNSVAQVDANGHVTGRAVGVSTITALTPDWQVSAVVNVKQLSAPLHFLQIATGGQTVCALEQRGDVYCWGDLSNGAPSSTPLDHCEVIYPRLRNTWACSATPVLIKPARQPVRLIENSNWSLAADSTPVALLLTESLGAAGFRFADLSIDWHRCGIVAGGRAYCWNANTVGQLGNGSVQTGGPWSQLPTEVAGNRSWAVIKVSKRWSTCGLTTAGEAFCWGDNFLFKLGAGPDSTTVTGCWRACLTLPTAVHTTARFVTLATSGDDTCALTSNAEAYCWGIAPPGLAPSDRGLPAKVAGSPALRSLSGGDNIVAVGTDGTLYGLQRNSAATSLTTIYSFVRIPIPFPIRAGAQSLSASCAISDSDGRLYCWGDGSFGALGGGQFVNSPATVPVLVAGQ